MKRILLWLMVVVMIVPSAMAVAQGDQYTANVRFEGAGFDTPEAAVSAYVEAMRETDFSGMIATFAIETLVEKADPRAQLSRLRSFNPASRNMLPVTSDYLRQIEVARRYAELSNLLYHQYVSYAWPAQESAYDLSPFSLPEDEDVDAFIDQMSGAEFLAAMRSATLVGFVEPELLSDLYYNEANQANIARLAEACGSDKLTDVAAVVEMNGAQYMLFIQCARYGDRWYNMTLGGNLASLLSISIQSAGLAGPFDGADELMK